MEGYSTVKENKDKLYGLEGTLLSEEKKTQIPIYNK